MVVSWYGVCVCLAQRPCSRLFLAELFLKQQEEGAVLQAEGLQTSPPPVTHLVIFSGHIKPKNKTPDKTHTQATEAVIKLNSQGIWNVRCFLSKWP